MFNRRKQVSTGRQIARQCWAMLMDNREWLKIPLFSAVGVTIVTIIFGIVGFVTYIAFAPAASARNQDSSAASIAGVIVGLLYYFVAYIIINFSEVALVTIVLMKLRTPDSAPKAADGFAVAGQRLGAIVTFSAMSATVGMIARMFASGNSRNLVAFIISRLIAMLIQGAWTFTTLMVTPVIAVENLDAMAAIGRSWSLFKQTWGEQVFGRFTLGFFGFLLTLAAMVPGLVLFGVGAAINSPALLIGSLGVFVIGIVVVGLLTNAASGIFKAILYYYATEGNTGGLLDEATMRQVYVAR